MNAGSKTPTPLARHRRVGLFRLSMPEFLLSLALMLVAAPFLEKLKTGPMIESILITIVLFSGVMAVGKNRRTLLIAGGLALPAFVGKWLTHWWPDPVTQESYLVLAILFMVFIVLQLIRFILTSPGVNTEVLCAGLAMYLLLGMAWAFAYVLVDQMIPGAFVLPAGDHMPGFTCFYYSFITLSTVGYGDITPVANVARMLAAAEAVTGTLFVAVFIARLVALYSTAPRSGNAGRPET